MNFEYSKIKGKIRELGLTQSDYAKHIGITEQTLNLRFKNKRPFTQQIGRASCRERVWTWV